MSASVKISIVYALVRDLIVVLHPGIKPPYRLKVSTFLSKSLRFDRQIRSDSKTMLCIRIQDGLISLVAVLEN